MATKTKNITKREKLEELVELYLSEDTLFRIVEMMDKTYNIHRFSHKGDTYFLGIEGDQGLPLIASTDPFHTIKVMEDYMMDDVLMYIDVEEYRLANATQNPKYLIN